LSGTKLIGRFAKGDWNDIRGVAVISRGYKNYLDKREKLDLYVSTKLDDLVKKQIASKILDLIKENSGKEDSDSLLTE